VKKVFKNTISPLVAYGRTPTLIARRIPCVLLGALVLTIVASSKIAIVFLPQNHLSSGELLSLLSGFAPLIGLCVLLIILALLLSFLICSVERTFHSDDDNAIPETRKKHKWRIVRSCPFHLLTHYLSLKEHSPPVDSVFTR
jgi:hypothetical protein